MTPQPAEIYIHSMDRAQYVAYLRARIDGIRKACQAGADCITATGVPAHIANSFARLAADALTFEIENRAEGIAHMPPAPTPEPPFEQLVQAQDRIEQIKEKMEKLRAMKERLPEEQRMVFELTIEPYFQNELASAEQQRAFYQAQIEGGQA